MSTVQYIMKGKRDSLRVWLEKNLNANKIRGLEWKDERKKIFKIRWKHASKHGWSSELDGCVFREWAIYSGKFKPGEDGAQEQPKVWKANFRCALNALPDIQEIISERETRGNEAQKVFHMKPRDNKQRLGRRNVLRYCKIGRSSSYQGACSYAKYMHQPNMFQADNKNVWSHRPIFGRSVSENPPPLLQLYCSSIERQTDKAALSSYVKTIKTNEPVLPENKIIDLIDSWSNELKEQHSHDSRCFHTSHKTNQVGYTNSDIDVYRNPNVAYVGQQPSSRSSTSRYFIGQNTVDESTQTCVEHVARI